MKTTALCAVMILLAIPLAYGQEENLDTAVEEAAETEGSAIPRFGGPSSVGEELAAAEKPKDPFFRFRWADDLLEPWFAFKKRFAADTGIHFGLNYNALTQWIPDSDGEDFAAGGIFEFLGSWTAFGEESGHRGSLTWKFEHRHRLGTDVAPQSLGFEAGILSLTGTKFSDYGWGMSNLFWRQEFSDGDFMVLFGWLDPTDYLDVYGLANPLSSFQNFVFTANPTIALPNEGSIGVVGGAWLSPQIYLIAGFADANGVPTQRGIDTFFEDREYFSHAEIGWTPSFERRYLDKVNLLVWQVDEREDAGVDDGWGWAFTATTFIEDEWMPFLRVGWSDADASMMARTVAAGVGRYMASERDLMALGLNWSRPADGTLDDQWTAELYYRLQLAQNLQFTPSLQFVKDPALNPDDSTLWVFGLRARLTF